MSHGRFYKKILILMHDLRYKLSNPRNFHLLVIINHLHTQYSRFFCLFGGFVPHEKISLICRRHHYRWSVANFDLCSTLMTIEQRGFFSVPHLLRYVASVYNSHLREHVTPQDSIISISRIIIIIICSSYLKFAFCSDRIISQDLKMQI